MLFPAYCVAGTNGHTVLSGKRQLTVCCVLCTTLASNVPESLTIWLHRPVLQLVGGDVLDIKCRVRALHGVSPDTRCRVYVGVCHSV